MGAAAAAFVLLRGGGTEQGAGKQDGGERASLNDLVWTEVDAGSAFGGPGNQEMWRTGATGSQLVGVGFSTSGGGQEAAVWTAQPDATVWSRVPPSDALRGPAGAAMTAVVPGGPGFVAVGLVGTAKQGRNAAAWTSTNARTWALVQDPAFGGPGDQAINRADRGGPGFVAGGFDQSGTTSEAAVWTSSDGTAWKRVLGSREALAGETLHMRDVTPVPSGLVAVGFSGPIGDSDAAVWTSKDGLTWSRVEGQDKVLGGPGAQTIATIVVGGPGLVAVGSDAGDAAVWTSEDGSIWAKIPFKVFGGPGNQLMNFATITPLGIVAVGADGDDAAVWVSAANGESWQRDRSAVFTGPGEQQIKGILLSGRRLIATGWDGRGGDEDAAVWTADLPKT